MACKYRRAAATCNILNTDLGSEKRAIAHPTLVGWAAMGRKLGPHTSPEWHTDTQPCIPKYFQEQKKMKVGKQKNLPRTPGVLRAQLVGLKLGEGAPRRLNKQNSHAPSKPTQIHAATQTQRSQTATQPHPPTPKDPRRRCTTKSNWWNTEVKIKIYPTQTKHIQATF